MPWRGRNADDGSRPTEGGAKAPGRGKGRGETEVGGTGRLDLRRDGAPVATGVTGTRSDGQRWEGAAKRGTGSRVSLWALLAPI